MKHCCHQRHYFFEIKKCGDEDCNICLPPRLPYDKFLQLDHLPDPMLGQDGHYKKFSEVFRTITVENHRKEAPSILPISSTCENCNMMLLCDECGMWHLIYATRKLILKEKTDLNKVLDGMSYLQEADLPDALVGVVYVKKCTVMSRLKSYIMPQILMISVYTVLLK